MTTLVDQQPMTVDAAAWSVAIDAGFTELDESLVDLAAAGGQHVPTHVDAALARFASQSHRSGALLVRNAPIGHLPPTPRHPEHTSFRRTSPPNSSC